MKPFERLRQYDVVVRFYIRQMYIEIIYTFGRLMPFNTIYCEVKKLNFFDFEQTIFLNVCILVLYAD